MHFEMECNSYDIQISIISIEHFELDNNLVVLIHFGKNLKHFSFAKSKNFNLVPVASAISS